MFDTETLTLTVMAKKEFIDISLEISSISNFKSYFRVFDITVGIYCGIFHVTVQEKGAISLIASTFRFAVCQMLFPLKQLEVFKDNCMCAK